MEILAQKQKEYEEQLRIQEQQEAEEAEQQRRLEEEYALRQQQEVQETEEKLKAIQEKQRELEAEK